jgi:hypothetical protein
MLIRFSHNSHDNVFTGYNHWHSSPNVKKEASMNLEEKESFVQQILDESNHEPKEAGRHRILVGWRSKLEKEPPHLLLHQIDEIVREVRRRLVAAGG